MTFLVQMLLHTPVYVYVLLAWLVWRGLLSLRLRTVALWRLFIVPGVFAATGLLLIWRANVGFPGVVAWLVSAVAFMPLGFVTGPRILRIDPSRHVTRAGSIVPLMRNLIIFGCQYAIAVALFLHPGEFRFEITARAVSGVSIGYFAGWTIMVLRRYRELVRRSVKNAVPDDAAKEIAP
jgi:hypothetical protein